MFEFLCLKAVLIARRKQDTNKNRPIKKLFTEISIFFVFFVFFLFQITSYNVPVSFGILAANSVMRCFKIFS